MFWRAHRVNRVNWAGTHQCWLREQRNNVLFSDKSRFTIYGGDGKVRGEMNVMPTVAFLNEIVLGVGVLSWSGIAHGFCTNLIVIKGNLNVLRCRDEILARHVISLFHNNANITLFQHDNATSHTARDTVNFLRANNIAFINDWPAKSRDLNPTEHL